MLNDVDNYHYSQGDHQHFRFFRSEKGIDIDFPALGKVDFDSFQLHNTSFVLVFQIIYFGLFGFPFARTVPSFNEIVSITFKFSDTPAIGNIMTN